MIPRALRLIGVIVILGWLVVFPHEGFHLLTANSLGYEGQVSYAWGGYGFMKYVAPYPPSWATNIIGLAGGIGTGLVLLIFWLLSGHPDIRKHPTETDNSFPFLLFGIQQLIYAPFDGFLDHTNFGALLGTSIGFAIPLLIYWKPLLNYLDGEEAT